MDMLRSTVAMNRPISFSELVLIGQRTMAAAEIAPESMRNRVVHISCGLCGPGHLMADVDLPEGALYLRCNACGTTIGAFWLAVHPGSSVRLAHDHPQAAVAETSRESARCDPG